MGSKKIFIQLENGSQVQVKWFEPANREDIEHSIRQAAGLTKSARFQLTDDEGDIIVLSSSIPTGTKLELHTIKAARASQTRKHAKMDSSDDGGPVPRKRLRSGTRDGVPRVCIALPALPLPAAVRRCVRACVLSQTWRGGFLGLFACFSEGAGRADGV
jgi:hypothetical protein